MGTPEIARAMLACILAKGYEVIGVVTQPDKKVGRKQILQSSPVKCLAQQHAIAIFQPVRIKEEYEKLLQLPMDLIVTCAYGQFIPDSLLQHPTYGSINVHASILPKLRGGAPIHKAIIQGDKETGVSIMRMVQKMDAGAVMACAKTKITQDDTMGTLYDRLADIGAQLLCDSMQQIFDGRAVFVEQNEADVSFAPIISKADEHIDFTQDVQRVYDHIRGLIPSPIGYAILCNKKVKFHRVRMLRDHQKHICGQMEGMVDNGIVIGAKDGCILVDEIQLEGKARSDAKSFMNGHGKQYVGEILQ